MNGRNKEAQVYVELGGCHMIKAVVGAKLGRRGKR